VAASQVDGECIVTGEQVEKRAVIAKAY